MELVEASEEDVDALVERWFALASEMESYSPLNELAYERIGEVSGDGFRAHFDGDDVTDYLVRVDGETVGFVTLRDGRHPSRESSRYLRIVNLFVDADHRDEGYGTGVVERVRTLARERGCDHLKVSCEWRNEGARHFYRETGFTPKQVDFAQPLE